MAAAAAAAAKGFVVLDQSGEETTLQPPAYVGEKIAVDAGAKVVVGLAGAGSSFARAAYGRRLRGLGSINLPEWQLSAVSSDELTAAVSGGASAKGDIQGLRGCYVFAVEGEESTLVVLCQSVVPEERAADWAAALLAAACPGDDVDDDGTNKEGAGGKGRPTRVLVLDTLPLSQWKLLPPECGGPGADDERPRCWHVCSQAATELDVPGGSGVGLLAGLVGPLPPPCLLGGAAAAILSQRQFEATHAAAVVVSSRAVPLRPTRTRLLPWTVTGAFGQLLESARLLGAGGGKEEEKEDEGGEDGAAKAKAAGWLAEAKKTYAKAAKSFGDVHSGDAALLYV